MFFLLSIACIHQQEPLSPSLQSSFLSILSYNCTFNPCAKYLSNNEWFIFSNFCSFTIISFSMALSLALLCHPVFLPSILHFFSYSFRPPSTFPADSLGVLCLLYSNRTCLSPRLSPGVVYCRWVMETRELTVVAGSFVGFQLLFSVASPLFSSTFTPSYDRLPPTKLTEWNSRYNTLPTGLLTGFTL